jgi:predicted aspartyl protease
MSRSYVKETLPMGKVVVPIKLTSFDDPSKTKQIEAIVDTGATMLVLPAEVITELGLRKVREVKVRYANNTQQTKGIYGVATLEVQGRTGNFDAVEEEVGTRALIGQIVLEELDLVVDLKGRRLIPNPESPDIPLLEIL